MESFEVYAFTVSGTVLKPIRLGKHSGRTLRGAILDVMLDSFCYNDRSRCEDCLLCLMCYPWRLAAATRSSSRWGANPVRPYTLEPPTGNKSVYGEGEHLEFGLSLIGKAIRLLPIVVASIRALEQDGIGHRDRRTHRRGSFSLDSIKSVNPVTREAHVLEEYQGSAHSSPIPITHDNVLFAASRLSPARLTLCFMTPITIVNQEETLCQFRFRPFYQRLVERLGALQREFCPSDQPLDVKKIVDQADQVQVTERDFSWIDRYGYSTRAKRFSPAGGLIGTAAIEGDLAPLLPWLIWGQFTHVGKHATKGNGWYEIRTTPT